MGLESKNFGYEGGEHSYSLDIVSLLDSKEFQNLLQVAQERGFSTSDELLGAAVSLGIEEEQLLEFLEVVEQFFEELELEIKSPEASEAKSVEPSDKKRSSEHGIDLVNLFLKDANHRELLTADQEVTLAKQIERGDMEAKTHMIEAN